MKTKHFLALSLVLSMAISVLQAQVRIGDLSAPRSGVSLDLNRNDNTATTGFGLPRVNLISSTNPQPLADNFAVLNGVMVYNLTAADNDLKVGPYFAGDDRWIRLLGDGDATNDKEIVLLDPLPATVWLGVNGTESRQLTVTTSIDDDDESSLTYRWYCLDSNGTPAVTDSTAKTFSISNGSAAHQLASAGEVKKYFCVVRNRSKSVVTTRIRAVYGRGVFLNSDQWLNVMNYNLGATGDYQTKSPTEQFLETSYAENIAGYLYQWGRDEDGHQLRDTTGAGVAGSFLYHGVFSATNGVTVDNATGQVTAENIKSRFILRDAGASDWRNYTATAWDSDDPCSKVSDGSGKSWRLPTSSEWSQIYNNNYPENTGKGFRFKPDGTNTSVFLPATGYRFRTNGALTAVGARGSYWSSSASGDNALSLYFNSSTVNPANADNRSYGFSVRCVAE